MRDELPEGWKWSTIEKECDVNPRRPKDLKANNNQETSFVPMEAVDGNRGLINDIRIVPFSKVRKGYTYFEENDVLFAKITPCMQNKKSAIAKDLVNNYGFGTTEFHVLRCKEGVIPEWIYYFIRHQKFIDEAERNFTGAVGQQRVPKTFLEGHPIIVPPIPEQQKIVDKLDKQMAQIEMMKKDAEIQMRDSTYYMQAYIKEIFENHETKRWARQKLGEISLIINGRAYKKEEFKNNGTPIIRIQNLTGGTNYVYSDLVLDEKKYAQKGDILFAWSGTFGPFIWNGPKSIFHYHIWKIVVDKEKVLLNYLYYFLSYISEAVKMGGHGAIITHRTKSDMENLEIPLPKIEKQKEIVIYIEEKYVSSKKLLNHLEIQFDSINQLPSSILNEVFGQYQLPDET